MKELFLKASFLLSVLATIFACIPVHAEFIPAVTVPTAGNAAEALGQDLPDVQEEPNQQKQQEQDRKDGASAAQALGIVGAALAGASCLFGIKAALQAEESKERAQQMSQALQQCAQAAQSAQGAAQNGEAKQAVSKDEEQKGSQFEFSPYPQSEDKNTKTQDAPVNHDSTQDQNDPILANLGDLLKANDFSRGTTKGDSAFNPGNVPVVTAEGDVLKPDFKELSYNDNLKKEGANQPEEFSDSSLFNARKVSMDDVRHGLGADSDYNSGDSENAAETKIKAGSTSSGGSQVAGTENEEGENSAFDSLLAQLTGPSKEGQGDGVTLTNPQESVVIILPLGPNGKRANIFQYASYRFRISNLLRKHLRRAAIPKQIRDRLAMQ